MTAGLVMQDSRLKTGRTGVEWRQAWVWPKATNELVKKLFADAPRPILHVCAGSSRLGDVRVDMFHPSADIKGDMYQLPFASGAFGTVFLDPPFPIEGTPVHQRLRYYQECSRVVRKGGLVMLHAPWMPGPTWGEHLETYIRYPGGHSFPHDAMFLTVVRRIIDPPSGIEVKENLP